MMDEIWTTECSQNTIKRYTKCEQTLSIRSIHIDFVLLHDYAEIDDTQIYERVAEVERRQTVVDDNQHNFEEWPVSFPVG